MPDAIIISEGTLLTEDLLSAFYGELEELDPGAAKDLYADFCEAMDAPDTEEASIFLNETLWDALDAAAPDGLYLGTSEGDGACFGFWPVDASEDDA
jgi:hypothetical protein